MSAASDPANQAGEIHGQVLEFTLGDEEYCISITDVTEIVNIGAVTEVPNTPAHVVGIMDLRGNTTTIVDPTVLLDLDADSEASRILVFDPTIFEDNRSVGWMVDGVHEVTRVTEDQVGESGTEADYVRGVVKNEEGYVVWVEPRDLHA